MGWNLHEKLITRLSNIKKKAAAGDENATAQRRTLQLQPINHKKLHHRDDEYSYYWRKGHRQRNDIVRDVIIQTIRELTRDNCEFANAGVWVNNADNSPPFRPKTSKNFEKLYIFSQEFQEVPLTVAVTVKLGDSLSADSVYIQQPRSLTWKPLKEWLLTIPDPDLIKHPVPPCERMHKWWKRNGRTFDFLGLPEDIRHIVYEYALGPEIYPLGTVNRSQIDDDLSRHNAPIIFGFGYSNMRMQDAPHNLYALNTVPYVSMSRDIVQRPNTNLLLTCRTVYNEAVKIGWEATKKYFLDPQLFSIVADSRVGPAARFNCLGKISLDFTNAAWFHFFGVEVDANTNALSFNSEQSMSKYLTKDKLPNLVALDLRFRNPEDGNAWSPWQQNYCHRTAVDMILTFAFPFVHHITKVNVAGYVKKATKEKWETIYTQARRRQASSHDQAAAMAVIFTTPLDLLVPSCSCQTSCEELIPDRLSYSPDVGYVGFYSGNNFDFEEDAVSNEDLNAMDGYGGAKSGSPTFFAGKLCPCGCTRNHWRSP
ncbi:hypothetical protein P280DRAFT_448119 [Massarina eburnea CBS 473.64]|uniref:Uncharacterized protein n=1 Tax=Massarina eburnea CBS 473.64 TaxID=1395130 RepID=A0A6A6S4Q9_9PLEO|nr:hypothetical protein P280DRAFT_448119 [Massarina eburnea CBS 473.64]